MRAKIGYIAILVLMGFLLMDQCGRDILSVLWPLVVCHFVFLLNWYAARHLTMHLQVNQDLNQVSTILIYVKIQELFPVSGCQ
ncbi:MAG: hypothetical protein ACLUGF_13815 [Clostridium sp.]